MTPLRAYAQTKGLNDSMKQTLHIEVKTELIGIASEIVYWQKPYWCNANMRQLKLSIIRPRHWYDYDRKGKKNPVILFICGGGFAKQDINVWNAELAYFVKHGYAVATAEYSTLPFTKWPEQIEELKCAVRYLRANAEMFDLDVSKIAVMGESAGGYLAACLAVTNGDSRYEVGEHLDQSSRVDCVVPWWPVIDLSNQESFFNMDMTGFVNCAALVTNDTPPMCIFHGTTDHLVPHWHSEMMYDALQAHHVESELYLIEGADHADMKILQDENKERMLYFLDRHMRNTEMQ